MANFTNQATLTYEGRKSVSNITNGTLVNDIEMTLDASPDFYEEGDYITYVAQIFNNSSSAISGLTYTDNGGAYEVTQSGAAPLEMKQAQNVTVTPLTYIATSLLYYEDGVLNTAITPTTATNFTLTNLTIPANTNVTIVYTMQVNEFASPESDGSITSTATLSGATLSDEITATTLIESNEVPILLIDKSVNPVSVSEDGSLTYTFVIRNVGNTAAGAGSGTVLEDTFDPKFQSITVTYNDGPWTQGTEYSYTATSGYFVTEADEIQVPAAAYTQNADGTWETTPGTATIVVNGMI